jgi:transposase IS66 family protein
VLERSINGLSPEARVAARRKEIAPLVYDLIDWMKRERGKLSRHNEVAKAMDYMLRRIDVFTRFLDDGRICLSNNAAERELRGIALGRKSWLFAGSDRGGAPSSTSSLMYGDMWRAPHHGQSSSHCADHSPPLRRAEKLLDSKRWLPAMLRPCARAADDFEHVSGIEFETTAWLRIQLTSNWSHPRKFPLGAKTANSIDLIPYLG